MRILKTRTFNRWAVKQDIPDSDLHRAVREMAAGLIDAHLGGGIVKKRLRPPGRGKRGGFRTLIATNLADRWIFLAGFAKNQRGNIDVREFQAMKVVASYLLNMDALQIEQAITVHELVGLDHGE